MRRLRLLVGTLVILGGAVVFTPAPVLADGGCIGFMGYCQTIFIDMPDGSIIPLELPGFPS